MNCAIRLSLKTVTPLEFPGIEALSADITKKLELPGADTEGRTAEVRLPGGQTEKEIIRWKRDRGTGKEQDGSREKTFHVPEDTVFYVYIPEPPDGREQTDLSGRFLKGLSEGKIRLGTGTTSGCGLCMCCGIQASDPDIVIPASLLQYVESFRNTCDCVRVKAHTDAGILIRDQSRKGTGYLTNEDGEPVIPALTWKGIFRNCIQRWTEYQKDDPELVDLLFGNRSRGMTGKLIFYDSVIEEPHYLKGKRLHLDKFSGTAFSDGFKEQTYVSGKFEIRIECLEDMKKYQHLLATVLRDLQFKRINVGADMGTGRGFVGIDAIEWKFTAEEQTLTSVIS